MKKLKNPLQRIHLVVIALVLVAVQVVAILRFTPLFAAATAQFTLSPASKDIVKGTTFSIAVNVNLSANYNASWADVYFNDARFQYIGTTIGSNYNGGGSVEVKSNSFGKYVSMSAVRNSGGALNGSNTMATIQFKALSAGSAYANFGATRTVLYPTTEYATSSTNGTYNVTNPVTPPPAQPPQKPPGGTTEPVTQPTGTPTVDSEAGPTDFEVSDSGLMIDNVSVSDPAYNTMTITWTTNQAANTKINFSTDENDLSSEVKDDAKTTNHTVSLTKDNLKAGRHYFFRLTSDDGNGPATVDSEFDTKAIAVIIQVTDQGNKPVAQAEVTVGDQSQTTDENGTAPFDLPEGEVTITANKDDLSREATETIEVPESDVPQQITLALGKNAITAPKKNNGKKGSLAWLWMILFILIIGGGVGFFFWRRRRANSYDYSDPLEADSYTSVEPIPSTQSVAQTGEFPAVEEPLPVVPPVEGPWTPTPIETTDPQYQPLSETPVPQHSSLPELVGRYSEQPPLPEDPSLAGLSPTGQPIPKHSSLKDLVELPQAESLDNPSEAPVNDLPVSPVVDEPQETVSADESHEVDDEDNATTNSDDGSLTIKHSDE